MLLPSQSFRSLFRVLLQGAGALPLTACTSWSSCPEEAEPPRNVTRELQVDLDFATLREALADGDLSREECLSLCNSSFDRPVSCTLEYDEATFAELKRLADAMGSAGGAGGGGGAGGDTNDGRGGASNGTGTPVVLPTLPAECTAVGSYLCEGRRHASWARRAPVCGTDPTARWFARAAANEAGSVVSFRRLARELRSHGLPRSWTARAARSARDEVHHARLMDRLAAARGARRPRQAFRPYEPRRLLELALENAREGCVSETYAALVASHQAQAAATRALREAFAQVAEDEARHAELAWDLHLELSKRLAPRERACVAEAMDTALAALAQARPALEGPDTRRELGLPDPETDLRLRRALAVALRARLGNDDLEPLAG
jgi:rubrerythrin